MNNLRYAFRPLGRRPAFTRAMLIVGAGILAGAAGAYALSRYLEMLLFENQARRSAHLRESRATAFDGRVCSVLYSRAPGDES